MTVLDRQSLPHFIHLPKSWVAAEPESTLTPAQRMMSLTAIIAAAFGVGIAFGIGAPLTSLTFEQWQQPNWLIGVAGAVPSLAVLCVLPFGPRWAAKMGAVTAIVSGCLLTAAGFVALYLFQSPEAWLVIRFLMSASLALPWLVGETWTNSASLSETRGRIIALYAISFFLGFAAGPLLLELTGISGFWPFFAGAAGAVLACVPILVAGRYAPDISQDHGTLSIWRAARLAPLGMAGGFLSGVVEMSYFSLLANVGLASGMEASSALRLVALLTIGGSILQLGVGWLTDTAGRVQVLVGLCVAFIALTCALPWALSTPLVASVSAFFIGGVVLGFYTVGLTIIGDSVPARDLTSVNAAFLVLYQVGGMSGPTLAGAAMTVAPIGGFVISLSAVVGLVVLAILISERSSHRSLPVLHR
jgi:MFS family permease